MDFNQKVANQLSGCLMEISGTKPPSRARAIVHSVIVSNETISITLQYLSKKRLRRARPSPSIVRSLRVYVPSYSPRCIGLIGTREEVIFFYPPDGQRFNIP
jgi:hypothetical protein